MRFLEGQESTKALFSVMTARPIERDRVEPGRQLELARQPGHCLVGSQKRVLTQLAGDFDVTNQTGQETQEPCFVAHHDGVECFEVALTGSLNEVILSRK